MSGVLLRTTALKIINKGGGLKTREEAEVLPIDAKPTGGTVREVADKATGELKLLHRVKQTTREKGSDYVVFICPGCNARQKKCVYEYKYSVDGAILLRCSSCYRDIEVSRPVTLAAPKPTIERPNLIVTPEQFRAEEARRKQHGHHPGIQP